MTEALLSKGPSSSRGYQVDVENPGNPGSLGHPIGCKPCNKYKPERPNDSCKHAATCSFCHGKEHERPKHRGQRGRHALQRRQFLEARENLNAELVGIIDKVYKVPHDVMDKMKRKLRDHHPAGSPEFDSEIGRMVMAIAKIGDAAQNRRPDNERVRKARGDAPIETAQVDLESRCKWYTGTLHLMVRKMWDEQRPDEDKLRDINAVVNDSLGAFENLLLDLSRRLDESLEDVIRNAVLENTWLAEFLTELVQKTAKEQSPPIDAMEVTRTQDWKDIQNDLVRLRLQAEGSPAREQILKAESLGSLREVVKAQVEADGRSLFEDEEESD